MFVEEPYPYSKYKAKLSKVTPIIFLAVREEDGELVGDSIAFERDKSLYIWVMGVQDKHRKNGIGTAFLEFNETYAAHCLLESVTVKTYNVSSDMQRLLIERGYHAVGLEESALESKYNIVHYELNLREKYNGLHQD
jgi:GNAT superfamily N-acetyltransferase